MIKKKERSKKLQQAIKIFKQSGLPLRTLQRYIQHKDKEMLKADKSRLLSKPNLIARCYPVPRNLPDCIVLGLAHKGVVLTTPDKLNEDKIMEICIDIKMQLW